MPEGITSTKPSHPKTLHDHLPMPDGKTLGQVSDLGAALRKLGVPNATADKGRADLAAVYAGHLDKIRAKAADAAVTQFLKGA